MRDLDQAPKEIKRKNDSIESINALYTVSKILALVVEYFH